MRTDFAFLHGGGQGGWVWAQTIAALREQGGDGVGRTLALDVPGCGAKRERDTSEISFDQIVAEVLSDIETAGLHDVVLVGHSQAGSVMPRMAETRPDLFKRLIYVSCSAPPDGVTVVELIGKGVHGASEMEVGWPVDPASVSPEERHRLMFCNDMDEAQAAELLHATRGDQWPMSSYAQRSWRYDHLAALPASYIVLTQDRALPVSWQERFAARLHAGRILRLDAGHQAMVTQPRRLAEIVLAEAAA